MMTRTQRLEAYIDEMELRYFKGKELTWLWKRTRGGVSNSVPHEDLWGACVKPLAVLDEIRHRLRERVRITSAYRSPAYNQAVGGERMSYHMAFMALDFQSRAGVKAMAKVARSLRGTRVRLPGGASFIWRGGIGVYPTFVHIDTRGRDADW